VKQSFEHIQRYARFLRQSVNRHGVHSPFLFELIEKVFKGPSRGIPQIEQVRKAYLRNPESIAFTDHGAGSSFSNARNTVKSIAQRSLSSPAQCALLYRLAKHQQVKKVLELGTSLGISTAYLATSGAEVHTIEGSEPISRLARSRFEKESPHIHWHEGTFTEQLPKVLEQGPFDLIYMDGDHQEESTVQYFLQVLPQLAEDGLIIFDDIHWSSGMERAWDRVRDHESVTLSVDLYWCGILFFRKGLSGEHFAIRY
jgi:predicted O-methyltransferase YrrM